MHWRNIAQLNACIQRHMSSLRQYKIECVVGIPRSGMLAASLVALYMNLPLTDVYSFGQKRSWWRNTTPDAGKFRKILLVDDSVNGGNAMRAAMAHMEIQPRRLAIYGRANSVEAGYVDQILEAIDGPRVFEWNLWKHRVLLESMVDIDGVLCRDPVSTEDYGQFIDSVEPWFVPTRRLGFLCTNRLEKYRPETENWLARHGILYGKMFMNNSREPGRRAPFKAEKYAGTPATLFIESDVRQATAMIKLVQKPVLCMETREMLVP